MIAWFAGLKEWQKVAVVVAAVVVLSLFLRLFY